MIRVSPFRIRLKQSFYYIFIQFPKNYSLMLNITCKPEMIYCHLYIVIKIRQSINIYYVYIYCIHHKLKSIHKNITFFFIRLLFTKQGQILLNDSFSKCIGNRLIGFFTNYRYLISFLKFFYLKKNFIG